MASRPAAARENGKKGGRPRGTGGPTAKTLARQRGREQVLREEEITAARVIRELARIAFADRRGVWDADGRLKPLDEWTAEEAACLEGLEVIIKNAEAGDGHTDRVHKVRLASKLPALDLLAKHFGLLQTKVKVEGTLTLEQLVTASLVDPSNR